MNINWITRLKNKTFWLTIIPAIILVVQLVASLFGYTIDLNELSGKLVAIVDAVFAVLMIAGVVNDPTTFGLSDSALALTYTEPKKDNTEDEEDAGN